MKNLKRSVLVLWVVQLLMPVFFASVNLAHANDEGSTTVPPPIDSSLAGSPDYQEAQANNTPATDVNDAQSGTSSTNTISGCQFQTGATTVAEMLKNDACKPNGVITAENYEYADWARKRIIDIANQIIFVGSLISVGAIVYAGFIMVTAIGDDEKIKNGKNSLKFGIIGFVIMLISFPLVNAIVDIFYKIGA